MSEFDPVANPVHYAGDGRIACMDALRSMMSNAKVTAAQAYWWGCTFKYLWRWPFKNGVQDVDKALRCLQYLREEIEDGTESEREGGFGRRRVLADPRP